jgi:hypothetical protein
MSITLLELRTQARQLADRENSNFVTDTELNNYVNSAIAELQDLLIAAYGSDYYMSSYNFTTTLNQDAYALPADFYKLCGVDAAITSNEFATLRPFNFNERNRNDSFATWGLMTGPSIRYRLRGNNLVFSPSPDAPYQIRLWYTPLAVKLVADSDVLADLNQYSDFVIYDAAVKMLIKEESDPTVLIMEREKCAKRIQEMAQNRDIGEPESVSDIYAENNDYYWYRGS